MKTNSTENSDTNLIHENEVLTEILTSVTAFVTSNKLEADVLRRLEKQNVDPGDAAAITSLINDQSLRHLGGWVCVSSCSLLEHSFNQIAREFSGSINRNIEIKHTDFAGSALDRWNRFFSKLHGVTFLPDWERPFVEYLYLLRNLYAHQNGYITESKFLTEINKALEKIHSAKLTKLLVVRKGEQGEAIIATNALLAIPRLTRVVASNTIRRVSDKIYGNPFKARQLDKELADFIKDTEN